MKNGWNFGIVGYGGIAGVHARSIAELPNARLLGVCGTAPERAAAFAAEHDAVAYPDYRAMLENPEIDIVCVLTPSGTHAELGIAAARAGKHVVVEKPIDISLGRADALIEACRAHGVKLTCISQHRYDHAVAELKRAVQAGLLGRLSFGASHTKWYRPQDYYDRSPWRGTWAMDGGGALINQSIHYVDLLRYMMGPVEEVFAYTATRAHEAIEVEDIAAAAVKFASGAVGLIEGSTAAYPGLCSRLDIYGTDGSVVIEDDEVKLWRLRSGHEYRPPAEQGLPPLVGAAGAAIGHQAHKRQLADLLEALQSGEEPPVNGLEARKTLEIVLAVYESARTGKPVRIKSDAEERMPQ